MQRKSQSVRLVTDGGAVVTVDPDLDGNHEPITLEVAEDAETAPVTVRLDGETADALVDAIDEARGRRRRYRRGEGAE